MKPYQFVLLRYIHDVSTEEFANIGVVMWVPSDEKFFFRITEHHSRLSNFYANFNKNDYKHLLHDLKSKLKWAVNTHFSHQENKNINEIIHQIVRAESGCFQWSEVMGGLVEKPEERIEKLFADIITLHEQNKGRVRREEKDIIKNFSRKLQQRHLLEKVKLGASIFSPNQQFSYDFTYGWQNGKPQFAEPISLDYVNKKGLENKTSEFIGDMYSLKDVDFQVTGIVAPPQNRELMKDFKTALNRLREAPKVREIITEDEIDSFIPEIERDLAYHY